MIRSSAPRPASRRRARAALILALLVGGAGAFSACKQGEGERCQVDSDCEDGLDCNTAEQRCSSTGGGAIDASVPDGPPPDAAPDAPADAAPDAPAV